jgi:pSer/pThr/pTyr-binding forkhead associated (FHA) protein
MESCPTCRQKYTLGALFCLECGTQLVKAGYDDTLPAITGTQSSYAEPPLAFEKSPPESISLLVLESKQEIILTGSSTYSLGRSSEGQAEGLDIDLAPFSAYEKGVSRKHAQITIQEDGVHITDANSSNGTQINGIKIVPERSYRLNSGDVLYFGQLKVQILF